MPGPILIVFLIQFSIGAKKMNRVLCGLVLFGALLNHQICNAQPSGTFRSGIASMSLNENHWKDRLECFDIKGYSAKPESVSRYIAKFDSPKLDQLGNKCEFSGRLKFESGNQIDDVNWFQGVSIYLARQPDVQVDWTSGANSDSVIHDSLILKNDGTFKAAFDLRDTDRDPSKAMRFKIGVALAKQKNQKRDKSNIDVEWSSANKVLTNTVQQIEIPASPAISKEIRLINQASRWPFTDPDGTKLIRAVNALQPMGKDKAIETLRSYLEIADTTGDDRRIVFWIVRILFEPAGANGPMPRPGINVRLDGGQESKEAHIELWPLTPMDMVDGVPFMPGRLTDWSGPEKHPVSHLDWAEKFAKLRESPITPISNPLVAAQKLFSSKKFKPLTGENRDCAKINIRGQACAMLGIETRIHRFLSDEDWQTILESERIRASWDVKTQTFRFTSQKANNE